MLQATTTSSYDRNIRPQKTSLEAQVRRLLTAYPAGLTNREMAHMLGRFPSTISGIVRPMVTEKQVYEAGERPCRISGNTAKVWRLRNLPSTPPQAPGSPQPLFHQEPKVAKTNPYAN